MNLDIAVIGGGPAGLAAALAAKKKSPGLRVALFERDKTLGGILNQCIHNGFGLRYFKEELTGPEYAQRFIDEVLKTDIEVYLDTMVLSVSKEKRIVAVSPERGYIETEAKAVILAMGCRERTRGSINIAGTRPAGVYTAGTAQRLVNMEGYLPGKKVVILGSGDIGLIMARRLMWEGAKVELVAELMPYSSGLNRNIVQCLADFSIPLKFSHTVTAIHGRERVEAVTVCAVDERSRRPIPGTAERINCDTLLLSVGLIPENELTLDTGAEMSPITSGAVVDQRRETSVPGVFACGNVLHVHDLVDNVSEEAEVAGVAAAEFAQIGAADREMFNIRCESGVRYAVPQRFSSGGAYDVYFRVDGVYRNTEVIVRCGEKELIKKRRSIVTPGEMEKLRLDTSGIYGDVTIELRKGKAE